MDRNNYCGFCMECIKTCPHDNMTLRDVLVALGVAYGATIEYAQVPSDLLVAPMQPGERRFAD